MISTLAKVFLGFAIVLLLTNCHEKTKHQNVSELGIIQTASKAYPQIEMKHGERTVYFDEEFWIRSTDKTLEIADQARFLKNKHAAFKNDKGETVYEYSGLKTDGKAAYSWAEAIFEPGGKSSHHFHSARTEIYYIISGNKNAYLKLDNKRMPLTTGTIVEILSNQKHQVINASQHEKLVIIVKCTPAWVYTDVFEIKS